MNTHPAHVHRRRPDLSPRPSQTWAVAEQRARQAALTGSAASRRRQAAEQRAILARPNYDGAELRPFDGRAGAMDAFSLPSRMGRVLVWRDGLREVVDG